MDLYTCSTPYQLMNAVILASQRQVKADVILTNNNLVQICNIEALEKKKIFHQIYAWDEISDKFSNFSHSRSQYVLSLLKKISIYFRTKKLCDNIPNRDMVYRNVFIGYAAYPDQCIYYYFKKKGASLIFYDEGTYTYEFLSVRPSFIRKAVSYIIFGSLIADECRGVYARRPGQVNCGKYRGIPVKQIDKSSDEMDVFLMELFCGSYEDISLFARNVLFFDQNIERPEIRRMHSELADIAAGIVGKDNMLVKLHPQSGGGMLYSSELTTYCSKIPFEIMLNACHAGGKVLISIFSTACFSPKYILDEEPYIIFLYKIMKFDTYIEFNAQFLHGVESLKRCYQQPDRVMIPETVDELKEKLRMIGDAEGWGAL